VNVGRGPVVAGGGLTGALLAIRLADRGEQVHVLDRRDDPRVVPAERGRSINLALSTRGFDALERVGLADAVRAAGVPMRGRMMHDTSGHLTFQPYGTDPAHVLQSVDRDALTNTLLDAVDTRPGITVHYGCIVRDVNIKDHYVLYEQRGSNLQLPYDTIYGADGAYSTVRLRLQKTGRFDFEQEFLSHGYKELLIPAAADGSYQLEPNALHIWPRGAHMMIALPNPDGSFTATLFWPYSGRGGFDQVTTDQAILEAFERHYPDALRLLPDVVEQFHDHPTSSLVTIRCGPWFHDDRVLVLGDAAHAVVPFYGQGANAGMEDVTLLCDALDAHADDRSRAFQSFYEDRKPHADALADLALDNFVEMRDHVASRFFLFRQLLRRLLHRLAGDRLTPEYTLVTFSRTPYADAVAAGRRIDRMIDIGVALVAAMIAALVLLVVVLLA
jgi:kynurenine 3-monooxygenase